MFGNVFTLLDFVSFFNEQFWLVKHFYYFLLFFQLFVFVITLFGCGFCLFLVFNNINLFACVTFSKFLPGLLKFIANNNFHFSLGFVYL